ncbi:MAG: SLAC1 anion channel family protein [Spirochaetales bacterium]|uniref:SLAC1 anion channel family protein n=1 Tax=Candidatus Thalassospirochaeta sargassi TaxID=3119039 RepID=A0AAJ1ILI6_9SPIO|nr:SLAC1 anion channel family protein [Spirochaetales bacterium]
MSRLKNFPISFFSVILGLTGFTLATQKMETVMGFPAAVSPWLLNFVILLYALFLVLYATKLIRFPGEVKQEFNNPVKMSFFPTISVSFLLLANAFIEHNKKVSLFLWITGSAGHFVFTVIILTRWFHHDNFKIQQMSPAWFIPIVGNMLVPIGGSAHGFVEISWFFFSIGVIFWILLLSVFLNRIIFHNPLPEKLMPTFFIIIAPPAIGFISLVKLTANMGAAEKVLYYISLFFFILLLFQVNYFRKIKFYLSWWAYTFPISAVIISTVLLYHTAGLTALRYFIWPLWIMLGLLTVSFAVITIRKAINKEICVPED